MNKQKTLRVIFFSLAIMVFQSCTKEEVSEEDNNNSTKILETRIFHNLYAPQTGGGPDPAGGPFTKFSFSKNEITPGEDWDIAFRGTTILVNGGASIGITDEPSRTGNGAISILTNTLDDVKKIPESASFKQDGPGVYAVQTGSGKGWYSYDQNNNMISPIAGRVFVVKTHDSKYSKFEIISYYKDAPQTPDPTVGSRYYTFKFVYLAEGDSF